MKTNIFRDNFLYFYIYSKLAGVIYGSVYSFVNQLHNVFRKFILESFIQTNNHDIPCEKNFRLFPERTQPNKAILRRLFIIINSVQIWQFQMYYMA